MTRTYGTYAYVPAHSGYGGRPVWVLQLEPAVAMRAKRVLGRARQDRAGRIEVAHTLEIARELAWFTERYPLNPADDRSAIVLADNDAEHTAKEAQVGRILTGAGPRLPTLAAVRKTPRPYQLQALRMIKARRRVLLGDDVGLGKTFTCLLTTTLKDALPAVIVPPTHLPPRWLTEMEEAFPHLSVLVAKSTVPTSAAFEGRLDDVTIVPYSKLAGWSQALAPHVRTVIFDEVQDLRHGVGTEKGRAAAFVAQNAAYVIGATATPIYNYGSEIWNIADILAPGELGTRDEFFTEWAGTVLTGGRAIVKSPAALGSYLRESGFLLARTREEVGRELPKTIKHVMTVDFDPTQLNEIRDDVAALANLILDESTDRAERFHAAGDIDWMLRQATGVGKAPFVAEFCKLLLQSEQKIIVWAWHRDVYDELLEQLADYGPRLYTGSETPTQKAASEAAFKAPFLSPDDPDVSRDDYRKQCRVLLMSLRSGSGVDGLQKVASVGVFAELDWSPQVHEQAIGRLRRDGMDHNTPPVVYFLVSDEGSDPAITEVLGIKRQQSERLMSKTGDLLDNATTDPARAKRLARQVLGLVHPTSQEQR